MANIRIDLDHVPYNGEELTFKAPCDAADVTGMKIYYGGTYSEYYLCDANGNNVGNIDNLFAENALVTVILETATTKAFIQNADTNAYLEGRLNGKQTKITASGILKGDGSGGVTAAVAGTDYGTYTKPASGIPKSHLASAVQTAIDKANVSQEMIAKHTISLPTASWTASGSNWIQTVTITGSSIYSKIDLQPDATAIAQMISDGTAAIYISNNNGTFTATAVGSKPTANLSIQATQTEVKV